MVDECGYVCCGVGVDDVDVYVFDVWMIWISG